MGSLSGAARRGPRPTREDVAKCAEATRVGERRGGADPDAGVRSWGGLGTSSDELLFLTAYQGGAVIGEQRLH